MPAQRRRILLKLRDCGNVKLPQEDSTGGVVKFVRIPTPGSIGQNSHEFRYVKSLLPGVLRGVGMGLFVGLPEPLGADVCVDLRRRQALMPQHFLDAPQIGPSVQKMRREAVP